MFPFALVTPITRLVGSTRTPSGPQTKDFCSPSRSGDTCVVLPQVPWNTSSSGIENSTGIKKAVARTADGGTQKIIRYQIPPSPRLMRSGELSINESNSAFSTAR